MNLRIPLQFTVIMKKIIFTFWVLVVSLSQLFAQNTFQISKKLQWKSDVIIYNPTGNFPTEIYTFDGALFDDATPALPFVLERFELPTKSKISVQLIKTNYEPIPLKSKYANGIIDRDIQFITTVEKEKDKYFGKIVFIPIKKSGGENFEKLTDFTIQIQTTPVLESSFRGSGNVTESVLSNGDIYKIAIEETGMHQLDYDFLKNDLGIDIDNVDPSRIQIFGNGGGMLPELNNVERIDDLKENPIEIAGIEDSSFDPGDVIRFYAEGADAWNYQDSQNSYSYQKNTYTNQNFYFLKIGDEVGKRISNNNSIDNTDYATNTFDDRIHFEEDIVNLLHDFPLGQGSGKKWFGDLFEVVRDRTFNEFTFPNIVTSEEAIVKAELAGRSETTSRFNVRIAGNTFNSNNINGVNTGNAESTYAYIGRINEAFMPNGENISIQLEYPENSATSKGWLDYVEVQARRKLTLVGNQMTFRDKNTLDYESATFTVNNTNNNTVIWDITDPTEPKKQIGDLSGNNFSFGTQTSTLKEFIAFNNNADFPKPTFVNKLANQNLHGIEDLDMLIIYPADFAAQAEQLAEHRRTFSNLKVSTVEVSLIFNEFSSGRYDATAIRDFAKMLHERDSDFNYLLLLGDGSFDARNIYPFEVKSNFIPVYETNETLAPIFTYPADDYYALLSEGEGTSNLSGALDIAVGRIPVKSANEAQSMVDKIIGYDNNPSMLGDWRNNLVFVGDDEDGDDHLEDADGIAQFIDTTYADFNINKIYFDAFQQVSTPGGEKYPSVTDEINKSMFKGALTVNYLGHGGSTSWAQERVLRIEDIEGWTNSEQLPLFVTATCSFTGYDDPAFVTAGERTFLNPKGGAIGLFTTVRAVYASSNEKLTRAVFEDLFRKENGAYMAIGEVLRYSKNTSGAGTENSRKFTLIGDPAMKLALPKHRVITTTINGHDISDGIQDTLSALQKVTITGAIQDIGGNFLSDFNGKVYPTIYDKTARLRTLGQDEGSGGVDFDLQKNVLFKGIASVKNGLFEFTFVVPKDIKYEFGNGKISYYAEKDESLEDATGVYEDIIVGGADATASADDQGPTVEVFMNNEDFVFGGVTNENPILLVKLSDDNGINVAGSSIGHDLAGTLDEDSQNKYLLNDFYEAALDDHTKGEVRFPLFNIEEGRHQIKVKAWDIANNSAEGYTEFVVASSEEVALKHVLNYPNPFTTNTNFQFEHNMPNQLLNIQVRIFTVSGKLVKTIEEQALSDGYRITDLAWTGTDDYGDQLARGVYLYKIKVGSAEQEKFIQSSESEFEKLVILK